MELKPGSRWKSSVCKAEVIVVRPPKASVVLECGGHPMLALDSLPTGDLTLSSDHAHGVSVGKRYFDEISGIETLGCKHGIGSLAIEGRPLQLREAKALPASD